MAGNLFPSILFNFILMLFIQPPFGVSVYGNTWCEQCVCLLRRSGSVLLRNCAVSYGLLFWVNVVTIRGRVSSVPLLNPVAPLSQGRNGSAVKGLVPTHLCVDIGLVDGNSPTSGENGWQFFNTSKMVNDLLDSDMVFHYLAPWVFIHL